MVGGQEVLAESTAVVGQDDESSSVLHSRLLDLRERINEIDALLLSCQELPSCAALSQRRRVN